jgi:hypothetical protein
MDCNESSSFRSPASQPGGRPPRTILEVLCREVGAAHPDGALKQIRTMKRLLRSHYHNQQRLQRWGLDGLSDAVQKLHDMREKIDALRTARRRRAEANVAALDEALSVLESARRRLKERAAEPLPAETGRADASATAADASNGLPQDDVDTALRAVRAVRGELDEMRMELWAVETNGHRSSDASEENTSVKNASGDGPSEAVSDAETTVPGGAAQELLDRLAGWLDERREAPDAADSTAPSEPDDPSSLLQRLQRKQNRRS